MSDRVAGLILFVISGVYVWLAGGYTAGFGDPLGPAAFPRIIGVPAMALSALLVIWPGPEPEWARGGRLLRQGAALAVLLGYALLLEPLGFVLSTLLAIAALALLMRAPPRAALLSGAAVAPALWLLFDRVLGLPLPLAGSWLS
ncbi:tripartite tricarboxylate transporter TctB family protein [Pikeienuella sp. HZG-20]|uniref:tripartite tricarboxylate transporter TctB family protein n=1 Tax=Paludibacillus litoralis TaxID=3133267 RepID=UPI0030EEFDEB